MKSAVFCLILSSIILIVGCGTGSGGKPENVVLIIVDTLRQDHLGCYGYDAVETPNIDALAGEGIRFENAVSNVPITLPSVSSILTSLTPLEHGVHYSEGFRLPDDVTTLAEVMSANGFNTAAFIGSVLIDSVFAVNQGFGFFDNDFPERFDLYRSSLRPLELVFGRSQRRAEDVTNAAVEWLEDNKKEPFFIMLHYFDPHIPYDPPPPFVPEVEAEKYDDLLIHQTKYYDAEIVYTDHQIGLFLEKLEKWGLENNTLVILTSDNGEGLGEKDEDNHGIFLYESTVSVPLILGGATGLEGGKVLPGQVQLLDIFPTVLDIMAIETPAGISGRSLIPLIENRADTTSSPVYIETCANRIERGWSVLKAIRTNDWKYVKAPEPELYSLKEDPGETDNIIDEHADVAARMEKILTDFEAEVTQRERIMPNVTDENFIGRVRNISLAGVEAGDLDLESTLEVSGPDPKDLIGDFRKEKHKQEYFNLALLFMSSVQHGSARYFLEKTIELEKDDPVPHHYLAEVFRLQGLSEKGLEEIDKVLKLEPDNEEAWYLKGLLAQQAGRNNLAIAALEKTVTLRPDHEQAYNNMGLIFGQQEDYDRAFTMFNKALEINPDLAQARANMGNIYYERGEYNKAWEEMELALLLDPDMSNLRLFLGGSYSQKGEYEKALYHYETFLETRPDSFTVKRVEGWMENLRELMSEGE
jgi:arylsulfatase A-like enzyme/Tfp pilus assembly protein PilF